MLLESYGFNTHVFNHPERDIQATIALTHGQNPEMIREANHVGHTHEKRSRCRRGTGIAAESPTMLGPTLFWAHK